MKLNHALASIAATGLLCLALAGAASAATALAGGGNAANLNPPMPSEPPIDLAPGYLFDSGTPALDPNATGPCWGCFPWTSTYWNTPTNFDLSARLITVPPGSIATAFRGWWAEGSAWTGAAPGSCVDDGGTLASFSSFEILLYADGGGTPGGLVATLPGTMVTLNAPTFYRELQLTTPYVFGVGSYFASLRATTPLPDYGATMLWMACAVPGAPGVDHEMTMVTACPIGVLPWTPYPLVPGSPCPADPELGLQVLGYLTPDQVHAVADADCITLADPCANVSFNFIRGNTTALRLVSTTFSLSPNLALCGVYPVGLNNVNGLPGALIGPAYTHTFVTSNNGGGSYTVDVAVTGLPCGPTNSGTLFTVDVMGTSPGTGTVTVTGVTVRDCSNAPLPGSPGTSATLEVDSAGPTAIIDLTATQDKTSNGADGTTFIDVAFTTPGDATTVEVYRQPYGNYPEYDDCPGAGVPALPSYPPDPGWTLTSLTGSGADEPPTRDFWYYVVFTKDACGNVSAVSNMSPGRLNYHLGDVAPGAGDNLVTGLDISALGASYGATLTPACGSALDDLDVGPTTDFSVDARPTTDNILNYEDLIMFAINFGTVSLRGSGAEIVDLGRPGVGAVDLRLAPVKREVQVGDRVEVPVVLTGKVLDVRGIRTVVTYDPGLLSYEGSGVSEAVGSTEHFFKDLTLDGQVDLNLATLGTGIEGSGAVLWVRFRALKSGALDLQLKDSHVRDSSNRELLAQGQDAVARSLPDQAAQIGAAVPVAYRLGGAVPNPFNPRTTISYDLPEAGAVKLAIYDVTGRVVRTLVDSVQPAGSHAAEWDGTNDNGRHVESGIYFYAMRAGRYESQRRMALLK